MAQPNDMGGLSPTEVLTQKEIARLSGGENISPNNEPFLGMIDNNIVNLIKSASTRQVRLQGGGMGFEVVHPDIFGFIMTLGHLTRTTNLDKMESRTAYFKFRQLVRVARSRHDGDLDLQDLLAKIDQEGYIIYTGDAQEGRRQAYLSTQHRTVSINQPVQKKSWWSK